MARGISQRDHAAERGAKGDRIVDPKVSQNARTSSAALRQIPAFWRPVLAAVIAAGIELDDLRAIDQGHVAGRKIE